MAEKPTLLFWEKTPPYAVVAAAELARVDLDFTPDPSAGKDYTIRLKFPDGLILKGLPMILKYLARSNADAKLYGSDALSACKIDEWMDYCGSQFVSGPRLEPAAIAVSAALALQTFFVGHVLSIADLCAWGALLSAPMWQKVRNHPDSGNLVRWFNFCNEQECLKSVFQRLDPKAVKARSMGQDPKVAAETKGETGSFDIELPGAEMGKVVTRFPPEPSGYLHIGHAKAALLNQHFADIYKGKLIVRFDDTNPSKESEEFVENIVDDMARLGLRYDKITYTSDYFPQMIELGTALIKSGHLYADNTAVDKMREERKASIKSSCFDTPVEENLRVWQEMLDGSEEGQTYCIRIKMDHANLNACLRDPVAFRCNLDSHHRTGTQYKCYPTYDFACPFVDSVQGVTHALRTSEYRDREEQFHRILTMLQTVEPSLPFVNIWDYSRLNFVHTVLSKRKLAVLVDQGVVDGWTDPRFPTVQGVLRRGMTLPALREFILSQGASKNVTLQEWDKIWTINKKHIDPVCPRHTACATTNMVPVTLTNGPATLEIATVPKHVKNPSVGVKSLYRSNRILLDQVDAASVKEGEEVTLMSWGNAIIESITKGADGTVTAVSARLHLEGDFKKTKLKLTWLADVPDVVQLRLIDFDYLITKPKIEEEDVFEDCVNHNTWIETPAVGDPNMRCLQQGDIIQLERKGYFRVDAAMTKPGKPLLLFSIPDGRLKKASV